MNWSFPVTAADVRDGRVASRILNELSQYVLPIELRLSAAMTIPCLDGTITTSVPAGGSVLARASIPQKYSKASTTQSFRNLPLCTSSTQCSIPAPFHG